MPAMTIGRLARRAGVGVETIRYYHREGLLEQPEKPEVGPRVYPPEALRDLGFVRRAKALGFTLAEIREMLGMFRAERATCGEVAGRARGKLEEVRRKIAALREIEAALVGAAEACEACPPECPCPVLERFPFQDECDGVPLRRGRPGPRDRPASDPARP